jgi:hypothetical protein
MYGTMMVNWSGVPIPDQKILVLRRVAVLMRTSLQAEEVSFVHDVCSGFLTYEKSGLYGTVGGLFFKGELDAEGGQPQVAHFLIPHQMLHVRPEDGITIAHHWQRDGDQYVCDYPDDVPPEMAAGLGGLKVTIRKE